jgi:hypothetical protein
MTIPTSYTIRALNRWLAALKLETDSPIIRALHAAVDELGNDPNDLVADAEALLLAAASMSVLSFDALEHAAGEIGLEVDEEDRSEVRESATVMQGLADLLGEIRTRTAEDREVEVEAEGGDEADALFGVSSFWVTYDESGKMTMEQVVEARVMVQALSEVDATQRVPVSSNHGRTMLFFVHKCVEPGVATPMIGMVVTDGVLKSVSEVGHVCESLRWGPIVVQASSAFVEFWALSPNDLDPRPDALTISLFLENRMKIRASCSADAALLHHHTKRLGIGPVTVWVQPVGEHGQTVQVTEHVVDYTRVMDGKQQRAVTGGEVLFTVEIIDEPAPGMTPPPQDVQDLLDEGSA